MSPSHSYVLFCLKFNNYVTEYFSCFMFSSPTGSRAGRGAAVYWQSDRRNPQCGLKKWRQIQSGAERCFTVSRNAHNKLKIIYWVWNCVRILILLRCRKLIHHRKETLARRSSSSSGQKQGLPSSSSEISLSQTPPPPNGLNREYGRQGSMPLSGSMDNMRGEQGFYQVSAVHI